MSSACEETAESLEGIHLECANPVEEIKPKQNNEDHHDHVKPKRRRRGKKRKHRKESSTVCDNDADAPTWDSDENLSCGTDAFTNVVIRPSNVPKAPENSTQFIMDDHNECRLYLSFETPNPYLADPPHPDGENYVVTEPVGEDAAYQDIDYEYESPQDFDNSAYYDREFELSYNNNRYEELCRLPRTELISALESLEFRLKELEDDLMKHNPSPVLEKLQAELLHLHEENMELKDCNTKLNVLNIKNETDESGSDHSQDEDSPTVMVEPISTFQDDRLHVTELDSHDVLMPCIQTESQGQFSGTGSECQDEVLPSADVNSSDDNLCTITTVDSRDHESRTDAL